MGLWEISTDSGSTYTDLADLYFTVASSTGTGMLSVKNLATPLAQQPGSQYDKTATLDRPFALHGSFNTATDATKANFHSRKATLLRALNANAGTVINSRPAPIVLKYTGATADKIIYCYYEGGFEDSSMDTNAFSQDPVSLRFVAFDPFFYGDSESNTTLDSQDSATFRTVAAKVDGLWSALGPPNSSGTYFEIYAYAEDATYIYIGGQFTSFDNVTNANRIVRRNKSTGAYTALGTGILGGYVRDMAIAPNGDLYIVGTFTSAGGDSSIQYIGVWDGSSWSAVGAPHTGASITTVDTVAISPDGKVYVGGFFSNLAGIAAADGIAYWDGSSWNAMGTGANPTDSIAIKSASEIYAVGSFTSAGGVSNTNKVALWDGSAWNSIASGTFTGSNMYAAVLDSGGNLYVGGEFTVLDGVSANNIAVYNGTSWAPLGSGVNSTVYDLTISPSGRLVAGGVFTSAGGRATGDGLATWNGSTWTREDINLPGTATVYAVYFDSDDDLYVGFDTTGTGTYAGNATVAYAGTAVAYPYVTIANNSGASRSLYRVSQITTGAEIYLDYNLLDGETLTIDFRPYSDTALTATSSFFGAVPGAVLGGSNLGDFYLTPGRSGTSNDNIINVYSPSTTPVATIYYTATYLSQD